MMKACIDQATRRGGECLLLTEHPRYDESSMTTRCAGVDFVFTGQKDPSQPAVQGGPDKSAEYLVTVKRLSSLEFKYAMLFRIDGLYVRIRWQILSPVLAMTRGTAETYSKCLRIAALDLSEFYLKFKRVQRAVCTDGDGAVARAERHVAMLQPAVHSLHTACIIHKVSSMKAPGASTVLVFALRSPASESGVQFSLGASASDTAPPPTFELLLAKIFLAAEVLLRSGRGSYLNLSHTSI